MRYAAIIILLTGCSASPKPDATTAIDALCKAAREQPAPATRPERDVRDAVLLSCLNRDAVRQLSPEAGLP